MEIKGNIVTNEVLQQQLRSLLARIVANSITVNEIFFESASLQGLTVTLIQYGILVRTGSEGAGYSMFRNIVDEMNKPNGAATQANIVKLDVQLKSPAGQVLSSYSYPLPQTSPPVSDASSGNLNGGSWLSKNKTVVVAISVSCSSVLMALLLFCRLRKSCAKSSLRFPRPDFRSDFASVNTPNVSSQIAIEMPSRQPAPQEVFSRPAPSPGLTRPEAPMLKGTKVPTYVKYKKHFAAKASRARNHRELEEEVDVEQQSVTSSVEEKECMICLGTFRPGEQVRMLPCMHCFHKPCVDEWLEQGHDSCPLCMQSVNDKPAEISSEYRRNVEQKLGISSTTGGRRNERRGGRRLLRELIEEEQDRSQQGEISESDLEPSRAAGGSPQPSRHSKHGRRGGRR